jgi:hypothetical protein
VDFEFPKVMQRWSRPLYSQELSDRKHSSGCLSGGGACNGLLLLSQKINRLAQARTPRKELTKFYPSPLSAFQSDHFSVFSQSCN